MSVEEQLGGMRAKKGLRTGNGSEELLVGDVAHLADGPGSLNVNHVRFVSEPALEEVKHLLVDALRARAVGSGSIRRSAVCERETQQRGERVEEGRGKGRTWGLRRAPSPPS